MRHDRQESASGRAVAQAKMEAMSHNNSVQKTIQLSKQLSKRKINKDDDKDDDKKMALKTERDQKRLKTLNEAEQNPIPKLLPAYDKLKDDIKNKSK